MRGLMQDMPLTVDAIFRHVEQHYGDGTIVTNNPGGITRATYAEWARTHPQARRRPGHARHQRRRPGRHVRLEQPAPPGAVLRRALHRPRAAHAQRAALPRAADLHRQPRRGRGHLRRPLRARDPVAAHRHHEDGQAGRGHGRRRGHRDPRRRPDPRLRDAARRRRAGRLPRHGRDLGRLDVLHERHHRQPQGRRLLAPLDVPAHHGRPDAQRLRAGHQRRRDAGRADVPRQRLGHRAGRARRRRLAGHARRHDAAREPGEADHRGGRHLHRRRPDHLAGRPAPPGRQAAQAARHRLRRLGGAEGAERGLPRAGRPPDPAGLGHDRDPPGRVLGHPAAALPGPRRRGEGDPAGPRRHPLPRRRGAHRRRRHPRAAALGRQGHRRAAGARPVVREGLLQPGRRRGAHAPRTAG